MNIHHLILALLITVSSFAQTLSDVQLAQISDTSVILESRLTPGTYLVESSDNLEQFLVSSATHSANPADLLRVWTPKKSAHAQFYRIFGPLEADPNYDLFVNVNSHSSHLASLVYQGKMEAHFFGVRDNQGLPSQITRMSIKLEGQPSASVVRQEALAPVPAPALRDLSDVNVYKNQGFVVVARTSYDCPAPANPPVIQVVAHDNVRGTVTHEYPTVYLERQGLNDIYSYEVVLGAVAIEHLDDEEAFKKALGEFATCFIPASNVPSPEDIGIALFCGAVSYPRETKTWPPAYATTPLTDIRYGKVRASIPVNGNYGVHASPWRDLYSSFEELIYTGFDDLPTLVIDIPCPPSGGGGALLVVNRAGTRGRYFGQEIDPKTGASWGTLRGGKGVPLAWASPSVQSIDGLSTGTYGRIRTQAHLEYDDDGNPFTLADSLNIEGASYSVPLRNGDFIEFSPAISGYPTFSTSWSFDKELISSVEGVPNLSMGQSRSEWVTASNL